MELLLESVRRRRLRVGGDVIVLYRLHLTATLKLAMFAEPKVLNATPVFGSI